MPVDSTNRAYDLAKPIWEKSRAATEGQEAMHAAGERFVPRLEGQSDEEYAAYILRALYFNATQRTIDGMSGLLFRKAPQIEAEGPVVDLFSDIDLAGETLEGMAQELVDQVLTVGRGGVLVDHPPRPDIEILNVESARALGQRPFLRMYRTESIIDWHVTRINNATVVDQVRLREAVEEKKADDEFEVNLETQIRVLDLVDGKYRQRLFVKGDSGNFAEDPDKTVFPLMNGKRMNFIPFIFFGTRNTDPAIDKPPLLDLVNVNISHYRTTADLEHGAHFTGLPTGIITGHRADEGADPIPLGSSEMVIIPEADAKAFMLEFKGQGLGALEKRLADKEANMAAIGAQMLAPVKTGVEAAETLAIRRGGENSVLASLARAIDLGLSWALTIMSNWAGGSTEVVYQLNKDYIAVPMTAGQITALVAAAQAGTLSPQELFDAFQRGEVISEAQTFEEHSREIESAGLAPTELQGEEQDLDEDDEEAA